MQPLNLNKIITTMKFSDAPYPSFTLVLTSERVSFPGGSVLHFDPPVVPNYPKPPHKRLMVRVDWCENRKQTLTVKRFRARSVMRVNNPFKLCGPKTSWYGYSTCATRFVINSSQDTTSSLAGSEEVSVVPASAQEDNTDDVNQAKKVMSIFLASTTSIHVLSAV